MTTLIHIGTTMALCYAAWGIFFVFLHSRGVDYVRHYWWTTGYFLSFAIGMSLLFWGYISNIIQNVAPTPLITFGVFMLSQLVLYVYVPKYIHEPAAYLQQHKNRDYLKINWRRLISKSADIVAQQVFIILLVLFLQEAGLTLPQTIAAFGVLFMLLHIPLLVNEWLRWPMWLFGGIVLAFSAIFPVLILTLNYGFVYNIILHWLFYTATAIIFWTQYNVQHTH